MSKTCEWQYERFDEVWSTECGNAHYFADGGPVENDHKFCPYCGAEILVIPDNFGGEDE